MFECTFRVLVRVKIDRIECFPILIILQNPRAMGSVYFEKQEPHSSGVCYTLILTISSAVLNSMWCNCRCVYCVFCVWCVYGCACAWCNVWVFVYYWSLCVFITYIFISCGTAADTLVIIGGTAADTVVKSSGTEADTMVITFGSGVNMVISICVMWFL